MFHNDVVNISFAHHHQIKTVFSDILGIDGIEHFSLDLVNPAGEMLFFSGTPQHAFEICKRGLGKYDGIISPNYYKNFDQVDDEAILKILRPKEEARTRI